MSRIVLFAGTTEGRRIVRWMEEKEVELLVCTATDYGKELVEELVEEHNHDEKIANNNKNQRIKVYSGRMSEEKMKEFLQKQSQDWVIDATHPYATEVTANIKRACAASNTAYLRVLRESVTEPKQENSVPIRFAASVQEAAEYLGKTEGNIFIATGSKELARYTSIPNYEKRCYARILSTHQAVKEAFELGFQGEHLIAMQGPFSEELNLAMLRQTKASYFVTKESGKTGGYPEKVSACQKAGAELIVIGRPAETEGMLWEDACRWISEQLHLQPISQAASSNGREKQDRNNITLIGIGPGAEQYMTEAGQNALKASEMIFGARRMLELAKECVSQKVEAYTPEQIWNHVAEITTPVQTAVLLSGDVSFYSGAKRIRQFFEQKDGWEVRVIPGISSIVYLAARLGVDLGEAKVGSVHGRSCNVAAQLKHSGKVFLLTEGKESINDICKELCFFEWGDTRVIIGNRLSYEDEMIVEGTAKYPPQLDKISLAVLYLELPDLIRKKFRRGYGFPDDMFVRGKVPMTKQEIRSVSLSSLSLTKEAIVYDVGAGTGSVAIEAALLAEEGMVYAIERNPEGCRLIEENRRKFAVSNLKIVEGSAPEALQDLPAPSHVFIGGTGGNLGAILDYVWRKNPFARIVVNAITVETLADVSVYGKAHPEIAAEFAQIQSARTKKAGSYHLLMGMNPVFVITLQRKMIEEEQKDC